MEKKNIEKINYQGFLKIIFTAIFITCLYVVVTFVVFVASCTQDSCFTKKAKKKFNFTN